MDSCAQRTVLVLAPLPGVMADRGNSQNDCELWAKSEVLRLFSRWGHWQKVADELAPYLSLSASAWWAVSRGRKVTRAKIDALRRHAGLSPRALVKIEVPGELLERLDAAGMTASEAIERGLLLEELP